MSMQCPDRHCLALNVLNGWEAVCRVAAVSQPQRTAVGRDLAESGTAASSGLAGKVGAVFQGSIATNRWMTSFQSPHRSKRT